MQAGEVDPCRGWGAEFALDPLIACEAGCALLLLLLHGGVLPCCRTGVQGCLAVRSARCCDCHCLSECCRAVARKSGGAWEQQAIPQSAFG